MSKRRKRRSRKRVVVVLLLGVLAVSGFALSRSRLFGISDIDVVGTEKRDVAIAASGIRLGQSVMEVDLDAVEDRIVEHPAFASARVERTGALGITITVVERHAALEVRSGDQRWFLGQDGVTIEEEPTRPVPLLLLPLGETPDGEAAAGVLDVWRALPKKSRARVVSFAVTDAGAISFMLGKIQVTFGDAEEIDEKVRSLHLVLERVRGSDDTLVGVDVRSPEHPAARFA